MSLKLVVAKNGCAIWNKVTGSRNFWSYGYNENFFDNAIRCCTLQLWGGYFIYLKATPTITHKIFETNSTFKWNSAKREKFNFYFSRVFC